ncbi:MAG: hypothetical protein AAF213_03030 [Pseudomonadota bacterium]
MTDYPFRYDADENIVVVSFYIEAADESLSGTHGADVIEPGEMYYTLSFEDLKMAGQGILRVDKKARKALITKY